MSDFNKDTRLNDAAQIENKKHNNTDIKNLTSEDKMRILDDFGRIVIGNVRDSSLKIAMDIVTQKTHNQLKLEQYKALQNLTDPQKEQICDLLSETVTDVIYRFLEAFEENSEKIKLFCNYNGESYDLTDISEKMGSEIADYNNGWIQRFSEIGRFVL